MPVISFIARTDGNTPVSDEWMEALRREIRRRTVRVTYQHQSPPKGVKRFVCTAVAPATPTQATPQVNTRNETCSTPTARAGARFGLYRIPRTAQRSATLTYEFE